MTILIQSEFAYSLIVSSEDWPKYSSENGNKWMESRTSSKGIVFHYEETEKENRYAFNTEARRHQAYLPLSDGSYLLGCGYTEFHLINVLADSVEALPKELKLVKIDDCDGFEEHYKNTEDFLKALGFKTRRFDYAGHENFDDKESLRDREKISYICNYAVHSNPKLSFMIDDRTYIKRIPDCGDLMLLLVQCGCCYSVKRQGTDFKVQIEFSDGTLSASDTSYSLEDASFNALTKIAELYSRYK